MLLLAGAVGGLVAGVVGWRSLAGVFASPAFARTNRHGRPLPTAAGLVVVLAAVAADALVVLADAGGVDVRHDTLVGLHLVVAGVVGLGLLGLLDDLGGVGESGGFRRHLAALAQGRVTTGAVKLLGGGAVGLVLASFVDGGGGVGRLLLDGALVALSANLGNLLDRAPGRTTKVTLVATVALLAAAPVASVLFGVVVVVAAAVGLLVPEGREQLMLGDVGANALGGAVGVGLLMALGPNARVGALVVLVALNAASEVVSFSRVIDGVAPLRWLDRLGPSPR